MSRYAPNCKYCQDRAGGCLYCVNENADNDGEKLLLIQQMIDRGEVHVVATRHTEEVLVRHLVPMAGVEPKSSAAARHIHHQWEHDRDNFKRRHCTHPGCAARQAFQWDPQSPDRNGSWVDVFTFPTSNEEAKMNTPIKRRGAKSAKARRGKVKG